MNGVIGDYGVLTSDVTACDLNIYYNLTGSNLFSSNVGIGSGPSYTLAAWQGLGFDTHSATGDPKLDANYKPQTGSTAIGAARNLTSLSIAALNSDKAGVVRPGGTTMWDAGAYEYVAVSSSPSPPTGLAAAVQ